MDISKIAEITQKQRVFFASGRTLEVSFRREQLRILKQALARHEGQIFAALKRDLNKPAFESYVGDTALAMREIKHALKNLSSWTRPKKVKTPIAYFPARSYVYPEPYGVSLIMVPWNFPVQLTLNPLVGSMAAGNCSIIKPSEHAANTSSVLAKIISDNFAPGYISLVEGGPETAQALLAEKFDCIFFIGGPSIGKKVMEAAARNLTPITLELGGKIPCIVDSDIDLAVAARRITWGKFFNAGQSCVAVDYLLAQKDIKRDLIEHIKNNIYEFYGSDPSKSPDYPRIINKAHVERLSRLLREGRIVCGGRTDPDSLYISPTIIDEVSMGHEIMRDEIFGPILPVLEYDRLSDAIALVNERSKPLSLYFFSRDKDKQRKVLREIQSGAGCINDTVLHETTTALPFGGIGGESGIGKYHGKASFDAFSHSRGLIRNSFFLDLKFRYPPYKNHLKLIRKIFK